MEGTAKFRPNVQKKDIDNGYAWLVLLACYTGFLLHTMTYYMHGVIYVSLLENYQEGVTKTSVVVTLLASLMCVGCLLAGILTNRYSTRVAITTGGLLTTTGFALSAFAPNINCAVVTMGVFTGIGQGLVVAGCLCAVGFYFEKYRYMVLSLGFVLMGLGLFISTPLALILLHNFGLSNFFLCVASITAHTCLIGIICKPSVIEEEIQLNRNRSGKTRKSISLGGFSLLRYKYFLCYLCTNIAWGFSFIACTTHLPNYIVVTGGTDVMIEQVMMMYAISNTVGRGAGTFIINYKRIDPLYGYIATFGISALITALFPFYSTLKFGIYGFAIQSGFFIGIPNAMMTQLPERFVGIARLSEANGLSFFFFGIGSGPGPFIIGFLYDKTQSYQYSFVLAGIVLLIGAVLGYAALRFERNKPWSDEGGITLEIKQESDIILKEAAEKT